MDATKEWYYWPQGHETVRVVGSAEVWGRVVIDVLQTSTRAVHRVTHEDLLAADQRPWVHTELAWRSAAARAGHLMNQGEPVAVAGGLVDPLPHQLAVLERALSQDQVRLLLADEVGLGKTIEAGLIFSELKARRRARRVLVVAPKGVLLQWVAEMSNRFSEEFVLVGPEGVPVDAGIDPWRRFDQVVCSLDSVKPLRKRRGWTAEEIASHNERRFHAVLDAGWDLVIIDEAHRVAGSSEDVARHQLANQLAARSTHLLLLSATPHSGKTEVFARLLGLLSVDVRNRTLKRDVVAPFVARTEKRHAVDASGKPLFQPRATSLETVPYKERTVERTLYEAVTDYVRHGYDQAKREKRPALGFLVLLMQRLVSSSTAAIVAALERRLAAVAVDAQLRLFSERAEEWGELTGEEQFAALSEAQGAAWGNERAEVELLLDLAKKSAAEGPDAKAVFLLDLLRRIQREEGDPSVKAVVFTEFTATQDMLLSLLEDAGIPSVFINGGMSLEERRQAQEEFASEARVLVSTDAGGEGINLQFAHVVINYDLPWNPMRIEQRIGRVDRIGQKMPVRAFNLVLENSVDARVLEVLEEKLSTILRDLGADKWNDVLETVASSRGVEDLYAEAIMEPDRVDAAAEAFVQKTETALAEQADARALLSSDAVTRPPNQDASKWADIATAKYKEWTGAPEHGISGLLDLLPESTREEAIPQIQGWPAGIWSLWEVRPDASQPQRDFFALFMAGDGAVRPDLAERVWVSLAQRDDAPISTAPLSTDTWEKIQQMGVDYAYRPCQDLRPDGNWPSPLVLPRLIVRTVE